MKVIVGLGNPGREYAATRHNVGWWLIDHLADVWHFDGWKKDDNSHIANGTVGGVKVRLVKPQTYMNLSGQALKNFVRRPFWSPAKDLLVVVDEVQLPVGRIRIRPRGSAGGHNGLKSIEGTLRSPEYPRLRIGVGPVPEGQEGLADYVLDQFSKGERSALNELLDPMCEAVECWVLEGIEAAMNRFNSPKP